MGLFDGYYTPQTPPDIDPDGLNAIASHIAAAQQAQDQAGATHAVTGRIDLGPDRGGAVQSGSLLPVSRFADGTVGFDPHAGLLGSALDLPQQASDAASDYTAARALGDSAGAADAAGSMLGVAGQVGVASSPFERPAGSIGAFGGRAADAGGAERIAGNNRFVMSLQRGADQAAKEHVKDLLPPPKAVLDRAVDGTKGLGVDDIMSSEPLWGYSRQMADQAGVPHSQAFSRLANDVFAAHGHDAYLTPQAAKGFMQMERLRYGLDPSTD